MRDIPAALAGVLAGETTTFAHLWLFTRRDGARFGFTDHDADLLVEGVLYEAASGLEGLRIEKSATLAVDTAAVEGALASARITEEDLASGLWDGAACALWRCDWANPAARVHLFAGRLGEVRHGPEGFSAELRGLQAALNAPVGRVYARVCNAELGDARCGVDLSLPSRKFSGSVVALVSERSFRASGLLAAPAGVLAAGRLVWAHGEISRVLAHRGEALELTAAPARLAAGQAFEVFIGCDKTLATCRDRFANTLNFRGFPHMPGPDAVIAGPGAQR